MAYVRTRVWQVQLESAIKLLNIHRQQFDDAANLARATDHPVPCDTRAWSQILVSTLTGVPGLARKKGADLSDGSDVKAANVWEAIDTPRFNGVIKSGRKGDRGSLDSMSDMPHLYFVMWDYSSTPGSAPRCARCRVWVIRPTKDPVFRKMCERWYKQRDAGTIKSDNFQLHPPRNEDSNVFRNTCGNLAYPLLFSAVAREKGYNAETFAPDVLSTGICVEQK